MHPKIVDSFWTDLDFESFAGLELAAHRLTFVWCITSPATNAAGIFPLNRRTFTGDTGLGFEQLEGTMKAFPRAFTFDQESRHGLVRNYIRYQIGSGATLATDNIVAAVLKALRVSPPALAQEVFLIYPELYQHKSFRHHSEALPKGLASPSKALPFHGEHTHTHAPTDTEGKGLARATEGLSAAPSKGKGKSEGESKGEGKGGAGGAGHSGDADIPTVDEVIAAGEFINLPEEECRAFWRWYEGKGWMQGNTPMRKWRTTWLPSWKLEYEKRQFTGGKKTSARLDNNRAEGPNATDLRAALQTEKDPARREALQKQLVEATR